MEDQARKAGVAQQRPSAAQASICQPCSTRSRVPGPPAKMAVASTSAVTMSSYNGDLMKCDVGSRAPDVLARSAMPDVATARRPPLQAYWLSNFVRSSGSTMPTTQSRPSASATRSEHVATGIDEPVGAVGVQHRSGCVDGHGLHDAGQVDVAVAPRGEGAVISARQSTAASYTARYCSLACRTDTSRRARAPSASGRYRLNRASSSSNVSRRAA